MRAMGLVVGAFGILVAAIAVPPACAQDAGPLPAAGSAAPRAPSRPLALDYGVYFGGLHVIDLGVAVALGAHSYDVTTKVRTMGLTRWLAPWTSTATTEGLLDGAAVEPQRHRMDGVLRGERRTVAIDYRGADVADIRVTPPPRQDDDRDPVTPAEMNGTLDPSSALLAMSRRIAAGGGCGGRVPIFDGRRRYDVLVIDRGIEQLQGGDEVFAGPARRCDFTFVPIAGYPHHASDPDRLKHRFRTGYAWFAQVLPGEPAVPVRIEMQGDLAATVVHLRRIGPPAGVATVRAAVTQP